MPKQRVSRELSNDGKFAHVQREVTQRNETKLTEYHVPVTYEALRTLINDASDKPGVSYKTMFPLTEREDDTEETWQSFFLKLWRDGIDKFAAADVYESLAAESTTITIDKEKLDLMTVPTLELIDSYNDTMSLVKMRTRLKKGDVEAAEKSVGSIPAWRSVAKKLTAGYLDDDEKMVAPVAKFEGDKLVALEGVPA